MNQIRIDEISGGTYPISVYISDIYGNNSFLLGTVSSGPVPPVVYFNSVIPSIFLTADQIMLTLIDDNDCNVFKILDCVFGCTFDINIQLVSCLLNITITEF
jgi:hypothetical protein